MLAGDEDGLFLAERLDPISQALADEFRQTSVGALRQVQRRTDVPYSAGRKPDNHEVATTTLESVPPLMAALGSVSAFHQLAIFDPEGELGNQVDLYVVSVESSGGVKSFLRSTSSRKRLKRTNRITAIWGGQVFETLEEDPLLFDTTFDAVVDGDDVYILNQTNFERSLGFLQAAREAAESTVQQAIAGLALTNQDEFLKAVTTDLNMISKARSIAERLSDSGYADRMTTENLIAVTQAHPQIELDWEEAADGSRSIKFYSDPQRRWRILKVLDDDYVQSLVTEFVYETNSKSQIE